MTKSTTVPRKIAAEINRRTVEAGRVNFEHAKTLHENGGIFAIYNALDIAVKTCLLYHLHDENITVKETVLGLVRALAENILPHFMDMPDIQKRMFDEITTQQMPDDMIERVTELMKDAGLDIEFMVEGSSLEDVLEQAKAHAEGKGQTRQ